MIKHLFTLIMLVVLAGCTVPEELRRDTIDVDGYRYDRAITPRKLTYFFTDETRAHSKTWTMLSKAAPYPSGIAFVEAGGSVVIVSGHFIIEKDTP